MKRITFPLKKWAARAAVGLGAALGLASCSCSSDIGRPETVYGGPDPDDDPSIEVIEDVYGPPVVVEDTLDEPTLDPPATPVKP